MCRRDNSDSMSDQFDCASSCPTARLEEDKSCSAVDKPRCVDGEELRGTLIVVGVVGVLVGVVLLAAMLTARPGS